MKYTITITKRNLNSGVFCSLSTRGQLLIAIPLSDEDANTLSLAELNSMFAPLKKDIQKTLHNRWHNYYDLQCYRGLSSIYSYNIIITLSHARIPENEGLIEFIAKDIEATLDAHPEVM